MSVTEPSENEKVVNKAEKIVKQRQRSENWSKKQVDALVSVWKEFKDDLNAMNNKTDIYNKIIEKLTELGVSKTKDQIANKMQKLRLKYREEVVSMGSTGASPSDWCFFDDMKEILKNNHYYNPDLASISESPLPFGKEKRNSIIETSKSKKQKTSENKHYVCQCLEEVKKHREEMVQERREAEAKFEKKLDDYMSKTSAFMDFIITRMSNGPPNQAVYSQAPSEIPSEIPSQNLDCIYFSF